MKGNCLMWGICVVIPKKLQHRVLQNLHSGHPGVVKMKSIARSHAWWPTMGKDVQLMLPHASSAWREGMHCQRHHSTHGNGQLIPGSNFILTLLAHFLARVSLSSWMPTTSGLKSGRCQQPLLPGPLKFIVHYLQPMASLSKWFLTMDHNLSLMSLLNPANKTESDISEVLRTTLPLMEYMNVSSRH